MMWNAIVVQENFPKMWSLTWEESLNYIYIVYQKTSGRLCGDQQSATKFSLEGNLLIVAEFWGIWNYVLHAKNGSYLWLLGETQF